MKVIPPAFSLGKHLFGLPTRDHVFVILVHTTPVN